MKRAGQGRKESGQVSAPREAACAAGMLGTRWESDSRVWNGLGLAAFVLIVLRVFWEILPAGMAFVAPDAMPFFPFANRTCTLENLLATGAEFTPHHLYWLIFPPLLANKLTYIGDTLMLVLAGVYYLRGRGTSRAGAWLGGLALGFSGYSFTLFSAGHRGYFHMMSCAVFAFGLLVRCLGGRRLFHFAMLGACLAWGLPYQPDVLVLVVGLAAAYTLWLTFSRGTDERSPWQRMARVYPRFLVTLAVAGAIAWPGLKDVLGRQMAERRRQMSSAAQPVATADQDPAAKKLSDWIFATNWSLPPEDVVEFVVPGIYGNDSFQPPYPYWGRLGQPYGWQPGQPPFPNYRQHTVYLGVVQVLFAGLAVLAGLWRRKAWKKTDSGAAAAAEPLADVPFWLVAGLICLLLAMGRYTPFYRFFYAIPYMDLIRAPVKFSHLVELCVAFLFGIGIDSWMQVVRSDAGASADRLGRACRRSAWLAAGLAAAMLLAAAMAGLSKPAIVAHVAKMGFGPVGEALASYLDSNLLRSALLAGAVAAVLAWSVWKRPGRAAGVGWLAAIAAIVCLDLSAVAHRFVRPIFQPPSGLPVGAFYRPNAVTDALVRLGGRGATVANYATGNDTYRDWFAKTLEQSGLRLAISSDPASDEGQLAQALGKRTHVLWQAAHVRFVIAPWAAAESFVRAGVLRPVLFFSLGAGNVHVSQPSSDALVAAEVTHALPDAIVLGNWRGGLDEAAQLQSAAAAAWDPVAGAVSDAPAPSGAAAGQLVGQGRIVRRRGWHFCLTTEAEVDAAQPGLLVLDERSQPDLLMRVDGGPATRACVANGLWAAVPVSAGHHRVAVGRALKCVPVAGTGAVALALVAWGLAEAFRRHTA